MPHRYLFALTDGGGTVPPELGAAHRLADRGHEVVVLIPRSLRGAVTAAGMTAHAWSRPERPFDDWSVRSPLALARAMADEMIAGPAGEQAHEVVAAVDRHRPDLVATSFTAVGAMIGAEARGVPYGVLIPNVYPMPAPGLPPFGAGLRSLGGPFGRVRDGLLHAASAGLLDRYALERLNAVRAGWGLDPIGTVFDQAHRARRELVMTARAFDFPGRLPANARYVGPVLDDPPWATASAWEPPPGRDPLVLVAMSSTFQDHVGSLQRVLDALGTLPVRGVVTTGPAVAPELLSAPENVTVLAAVPHDLAMRHASLVVTHGGHGTVIKALAHDLPLVVLPHGRDQPDNAVRVTERGAGLSLSRRSSPRAIARAVSAVLGSSAHAAAARLLGERIRAEARSDALVDELERLPAAPRGHGDTPGR